MKSMLVLGAAALASAALGCGGGDGNGNNTGGAQNTGGGGGHVAGPGGSGGQGSGASNPGVGGGGGSSSSTSSTGGSNPAGCKIFPDDNWWNTDVSSAPVDDNSDKYIKYIKMNGGDGPLHADFDSIGDGIPYNVVDGSVTKVPVTFHYDDQSDHEDYPIPPAAKIEKDNDGHLLMVNLAECRLYELGNAKMDGSGWHAGAGAIWNLRTNELRHDCWTSADAAGLPIYAGLVRFDEVAGGAINHAIRFTVDVSRQAWIKPARHQAGANADDFAPPMGLRLRLKSSAHVNGIMNAAGAQPKVVMKALQTYGMFLADNGSNWYISGEPNDHWVDDDFHGAFDQISGDDFEVLKPTEPLEDHSDPSCQ